MKLKVTKIFLLCLMMLSLFSVSVPVKAQEETPYIQVGVLMVIDEEFYDLGEDHLIDTLYSIELANLGTNPEQGCYDSFGGTFGLHFEVVGLTAWDSTDGVHDPAIIAYECYSEVQWELAGGYWNGYPYDIVMMCTGQDLDDVLAVAWYDNNCTLFEAEAATWPAVVRHEFSHLFGADECTDECVMNAGTHVDWCDDCEDVIHENKFRYTVVGDVNGDYTVDIFDAGILAGAFGSNRGDEDFVASCDINGDNTIDIFDAVMLAGNFGESRDPPHAS